MASQNANMNQNIIATMLSFNNPQNMPGMQKLQGPQGYESLVHFVQTKGTVLNTHQYQVFEGITSLGIQAPTIAQNGVGPLGQVIPRLQKSKISNKNQGAVQSYAANTHNGTSRHYNEDRISIVLDLKKPGCKPDEQLAPGIKQASFFAVFDGHGGHGCAEFLRDNLHNIIANQASFPLDPEHALNAGFKEAEAIFMKQNQL